MILKALLIACLASVMVLSQDSFSDQFQEQNNKNSNNCVQKNRNNQCILCDEDYQLVKYACVRAQKEKCNRQQGCSEAQRFGSQGQIQQFIKKYSNIGPQLKNQSIVRQVINNDINLDQTPKPQSNEKTSRTNNQIEDVDEADVLKIDGIHIYAISNGILSIVLAYPANVAEVISTITFVDEEPQEIFIQGNFLTILGTKQINDQMSQTFVKIYDIKNKKTPFLVKQLKVCGKYFGARKLNNGYMYLTSKYDFSNTKIYPFYDFGSGEKKISHDSIFWYPGNYSQPLVLNVISVNIGNPKIQKQMIITFFVQDSSIFYMSRKNIILASVFQDEKGEYTKIRKIYASKNLIKPFADGKIRGKIKDKFHIYDSSRFVYIVSTVVDDESNLTTNQIIVMDYFLEPYGKLNNVAPDDSIYVSHFIDNKLYLQTSNDKFMIVSLSNPRRPQLLGQLRTKGLYRFYYPIDQNRIIALGQLSKRNSAIKLSLFDISNPRKPTLLDNAGFNQMYSNFRMIRDRKGFLYYKQQNLFIIPVYTRKNDMKIYSTFVFELQPQTIQFKAAINHISRNNNKFYSWRIERSLYIENNIYTKSKCLIKINKIGNFSKLKSIRLKCNPNNLSSQENSREQDDTGDSLQQ